MTTTRDPDPPPKQDPYVAPEPDESDAENQRRSEIATLRAEIQAAIDRIETALHDEQFAQASEELERAAQKAERYPEDLWQEREALTRLRIAIADGRLAIETRRQWDKRIADIEADLQRTHWPEAERFAQQIIDDAHAPRDVAARARELLQQAKDGRIDEFRATQVGPTTNSIRKPSTPPRKND